MQHREGEQLLFGVVHAVQVNCHQQRAYLVVGDSAVGDAGDEKSDLLAGELFTVTLFADYVLRSHSGSANC